MEPVSAYQDRAVVIKSDSDGLPVSASTQPTMMAIMLGQLGLGPQPGLHAQAVDGPAPTAGELYEALSGPAEEEAGGVWASSIAQVADFDLWLTLTEPGLTRLNLMGRHETHASPAQQRIANLMPLGGLARVGGPSALGVAAFTFEDDETQPGSFKITACGYGPGGPNLATHLAAQARVWEELGRPGGGRPRRVGWTTRKAAEK
jgi:hypothetical protein